MRALHWAASSGRSPDRCRRRPPSPPSWAHPREPGRRGRSPEAHAAEGVTFAVAVQPFAVPMILVVGLIVWTPFFMFVSPLPAPVPMKVRPVAPGAARQHALHGVEERVRALQGDVAERACPRGTSAEDQKRRDRDRCSHCPEPFVDMMAERLLKKTRYRALSKSRTVSRLFWRTTERRRNCGTLLHALARCTCAATWKTLSGFR